jgi:prefoldin subunit 5
LSENNWREFNNYEGGGVYVGDRSPLKEAIDRIDKDIADITDRLTRLEAQIALARRKVGW